METHRRRQHHSCDQCRKGKRACDASVGGDWFGSTSSSSPDSDFARNSSYSACSNCKRYKKECTFNWLCSNWTKSKEYRKRKRGRKTTASTPQDHEELASLTHSFQGPLLEGMLYPPQWCPENPRNGVPFFETSSSAVGTISEFLEGEEPGVDPFGMLSESTNIPDILETNGLDFNYQSYSMLSPLDDATEALQELEERSPGLNGFPPSSLGLDLPGTNGSFLNHFPGSMSSKTFKPEDRTNFCALSDGVADGYARSMMTQNLIHIYHDSMENMLSCWLTERNCPYSSTISSNSPANNLLFNGVGNEWGPNWSNRIFTRVRRLDRAPSSVRGRRLSVAEDRMASRVLHTSIMAFASQWTQHSQEEMDGIIPAFVPQNERSIREYLWNKARHALESAAGIPSFRIIFANLIFSLTQHPLVDDEDVELGQLFENDSAPMFLETALRQLFTFRYKLTRLQRETGFLKEGSNRISKIPNAKYPWESHKEPILTDPEYRDTFNLLFWLGVMFDTLTAAVYQRPLVVSDEDSQILFVPSPEDENQLDLDGWNLKLIKPSEKKQDLWDDFFLRNRASRQNFNSDLPGWPCSYEGAAETLSDAAPVKVLFFRRVTHLQTLVYRGTEPDSIEEAIQKTLVVYRHWNCTYKRFMLDCIANHDNLPPRIQSWYVVLAAHWHLAGMLLADTVESIDQARIGLDCRRESRHAMFLVSTLSRDNALAVGALAQCSLNGQDSSSSSTRPRQFHDSLDGAAFLTEPWTAVLVRSFAKAAYILLDDCDMLPRVFRNRQVAEYEYSQHCKFCIHALRCLGRKSDMASLIARRLSQGLEKKPK